jgi:putative addiction module killer protein
MIPSRVVTLREYVDQQGQSRFGRWFATLDAPAAARVTVALARIEQGNFSNVKGAGVIDECRIDFGPGYRVYFGKDGETLVILLAGGTKKRQQADIAAAQERWKDYRRRKTQEH